MNNHHEYTIYEEGSKYYDQGWTLDKLARQVTDAVCDPFEVALTAYNEKGVVLLCTTIKVGAVRETLATWLDCANVDRIRKITYQFSVHQLDQWVDVDVCSRRPIPNGVAFMWTDGTWVYGSGRSRNFNDHWLVSDKPDDHLFELVKAIYVPKHSRTPLSTYHVACIRLKEKADQKSSSQMLSAKAGAQVQSDLFPRQHLSEADLRELGVPSFLFKGKADPERPATDTPSNP